MLTHLDQPFDAEGLARWLERASVSLAWLGTSQAVADNLERATPSLLGAMLARGARREDVDATPEAPAEARISAVAVNV